MKPISLTLPLLAGLVLTCISSPALPDTSGETMNLFKISAHQINYYVQQADELGPDWMFEFDIIPVVKNIFTR